VRILGVDPGLAIVGFGVLDVTGWRAFSPVTFGCIRTPAGMPTPTRLRIIYDDFKELIERYKPSHIAMERLYFKQNITTGIQVASAMGVLQLALEQAGLPLEFYSPNQIKSRLLGYGHGEKSQIQYMVCKTLGLKEKPTPDDAADGLAVALCHGYSLSSNARR
jgi:crossover junction endodeoxyribonuclease RuvC